MWRRRHCRRGRRRAHTACVGVDTAALLAVLDEVRALLALPDNDYSWSSFADAEAALAELEGLRAGVVAGHPDVFTLRVVFAPTGPIQEVSLSSGWGDEFLAVAERFDAAVGGGPQ
jgi:hypothetical protein